MGSSPRMRGTLGSAIQAPFILGIIPAYAGNTTRILRKPLTNRDHPRVCGEHAAFAFAGLAEEGSSPRMRGTRHDSGGRAIDSGIIPAYAGNTSTIIDSRELRGDHPRVCGEHSCRSSARTCPRGSSPRMRGTLFGRMGRVQPPGIIPAYAGNTLVF